jgi:hypothetical protein
MSWAQSKHGVDEGTTLTGPSDGLSIDQVKYLDLLATAHTHFSTTMLI